MIRSTGVLPFKTTSHLKNLIYCVAYILLLQACNLYRVTKSAPRRVYVKNENSKPAYLIGRSPGNNWVEHSKPQFKALQSFEGRVLTEKSLILLYKFESAKSQDEYLESLRENLQKSGADVEKLDKVDSPEGDWSTIMAQKGRSITQFFAIRKNTQLYYIQFTAPNSEIYSLLYPDVKKYINNFWFLYRKKK